MQREETLQFGKYYHIYNRGNNYENIFIENRNYAYFLFLWAKHIEPVATTVAFCLLRNHFHFLIFMKQEKDIRMKPIKAPSQYFSNFFNAYARTINATYHRTGALFHRPFRRIEVSNERYLQNLIAYIHQNPQKHKFVDDFRDWPYSSYRFLSLNQPSKCKEEMLKLFSGEDELQAFHQVRLGPEFDSFLNEDGLNVS